MFDIQNYASFVLAVLVFQLIPGAGTIAIVNATARNGTAAGMAAVAGTLAGEFRAAPVFALRLPRKLRVQFVVQSEAEHSHAIGTSACE